MCGDNTVKTKMCTDKIILASKSPRRRELINYIFHNVEICASNWEEVYPDGLPFDEIPSFLAVGKAREIAQKNPDTLVISADTGVFFNGRMLGKPQNEDQAEQMLKLLSGNTHVVITGCCLCKNGKTLTFSEKTSVIFYPLTEKEIKDYIATGEPMDKAGAYGIQGLGGLFIKEIYGDYYNVVGLPIARLKREIERFSIITEEK